VVEILKFVVLLKSCSKEGVLIEYNKKETKHAYLLLLTLHNFDIDYLTEFRVI